MQLPVEDVLVVHPNAGRRAALASALPSCRVVAVGSKREATLQMADATPALIIAPPDDARRFLREVDRSAPEAMRVFVCSQSDPAGLEELMQTAAEGHVFSILDETLAGPELGQTLTHLLQHRGSAIISLPPSYITRFTLGGKEYTARCVEVGNFGATLHLPIEAPLMAFVPGTALRDVRIERDGRFVMKAAWAYVQRAQPMRGAEVTPYLRLGLAWNLAMYQPPQVPSVTLDEPSEVLATLRKALRRETTFWLQPEGETSMQIRLDDAVLDVVDELAVLRGVSSAPPGILGDVVHLSFEMGGQSYGGVGSLLDFSPDGKTLVRVPRGLTIRNWRRLPRFKPGPQNRFLISFQAPVTSQFTTRAVLDMSVGGLSFPFDASSEILPAGLQLDAALLLPDGSRVPCPLEVRSIHALTSYGRTDGGSRPFRAGASFISLPASAREAILTAFISNRCPSAQDGARIPFDGIWSLMDQARYRFHPDYPFDMDRRVFEQLADTHLKLYSTGDLGRCVVYSGEQGPMGHAAGLRIHSRTWLVQHLAVRPTFRRQEPISQDLSALLVELGEALDDIEFVRFSWRKDNRWPNRLASWVSRLLHGQGLSLLRHFNYLRLPLDASTPAPAEGLPPVRSGEHADFVWLEGLLRGRGELVRVLSEDLQADMVELDGLGARFQAHGLHRRRRVFVVDGEHGPLGVALSEEGSPGLNLIEKTNSFSLILAEPSHPQAGATVRALTQRCVQHARERGRPSAIGLVEDEYVDWVRQAGFENLGRFSEWIFHRSMIRGWCDLVKSLFERLLRSQAKQEHPSEDV